MCWKSCNSRLTGPLSHLFCNMFGFFLISFKIRNVDRRAKGKYGIFKIHIYWQPDSEHHLCLQGVIPPAVNALHLHLQPEGTSPHPRINLCHIFVKHKSPQTRYPQSHCCQATKLKYRTFVFDCGDIECVLIRL